MKSLSRPLLRKKRNKRKINFDATMNYSYYDSYSCLSSTEVVDFVKENTSDTVFEDFVVWLEENEARFNP